MPGLSLSRPEGLEKGASGLKKLLNRIKQAFIRPKTGASGLLKLRPAR